MRKHSLSRYLLYLVALVTITIPGITNAAYAPVSRNLCSLGIYPFNPDASGGNIVGELATQWINLFNQSDSLCTDHLTYPNAYTQPPQKEDSPLKGTSGIEDIQAPKARHTHRYFNDSVEDSKVYKSFIDKFVVTIESDGLNGTHFDKYNPICYTWDWGGGEGDQVQTVGCNGHLSMYGGTNISYNSSTGDIVWEFGVDSNPKAGRPYRFGDNPSIDSRSSNDLIGFNTSTEANRKFPVAVVLVSKDNPDEIWSGTTTSKVLVRDVALSKSNLENFGASGCTSADDYSHWCTLPRPSVSSANGILGWETVGGKDYYWIKIGTVGSVWRKPSTPPPEATCEKIELTPNTVTAPGTTLFTAKVTFDDGNDYTTEVTWSQVGTGSFSGATVQNHSSSLPYFGNYTTAGNTAEVTAKVTGVTGAKNSTKCQQGVTVKNPPSGNPYCKKITLTPSSLNAPGSTVLQANVTYSDGNSYNTEVTWEQTGSGSFSGANPQAHTSSLPFTNTYNTASDTASVTAKVTGVLVLGVDNSPECQKGITITNNTPDKECKALNANPGSSIDLPAGTSQLISASPENTDGTKPTKIHWSETGNGYFSAGPASSSVAGILMGCLAALPTDAHSANTSFSAPYQCDYYYTASPDGTGSASFEAEPNLGNKGICKGVITESDKPGEGDEPYCAGLILDPNKLDEDGETDLHATVLIGNDDGLPHETTVEWDGDGNFSDFSPAETGSDTQKSFGKNFYTTFDANNPDESEASVRVTSITGIDNDSLGVCKDWHKFKKPNENEKCEYFDTTEKLLPNGNYEVCVDSNDEYIDKNGRFTIEFNGDKKTKYVPGCVEVPANTEYDLYATDEPQNEACRYDDRDTGKRPPKLEKYVRKIGKDYRKVVSIATTETEVEYKLVFTPSEPNTIAFITDTIGQGIPGVTYGDQGPQPGGKITYDDSLKIEEEGYGNLESCGDLGEGAKKEHCYNGPDLNGIELVKVSNPVTITYKGKVAPYLTEGVCKEGHICQEKFNNVAKAIFKVVDENDEVVLESEKPLISSATVQIFCQYILTRAAGDVYLEKDLDAGVDIRKCSKYTSTTGIILTPAPPPDNTLSSEGIPTQIVSIDHEICTEGQSGSLDPALKPFYGKDVSEKLSSQICEVKLQTGTQWKKSTIVNNIDENKTRISRWKANSTVSTTLAALAGANPALNVLHVKGGNLTVDQDFTLADGEGAKTIIVEDGDLIINKNIKYGVCNKVGGVCNVTDTASLAFIVLNGNVYVDPSVTEISGVFFVQGTSDKGHLYAGAPGNTDAKSYEKLEIFGSVYGDIEPLFLNRLYAGDPSQEEAGIVIRFDERVILNTPPGLREVLSVSQSEVAR